MNVSSCPQVSPGEVCPDQVTHTLLAVQVFPTLEVVKFYAKLEAS